VTQSSFSARLPATWRDFALFLRRPDWSGPVGLRAGWRQAAAMLGLNLAGLAVLLLVLPLWQKLTGIGGPSAFEGWSPLALVLLVVLAAPLVEESLFRGWMSGRPRALWLLGCVLVAVALFALLAAKPVNVGLALLGSLLVALIGWLVLRKRAAPGWFAKCFPALFFVSAGLFALVHMFNYSAPGLLHLPMILPQLWAGLTLGFVRTRVGLPASMLVHGASNALALGLAAASGQV
jgi:membrane protease YdiL (CAAX protease family)